MTDEQAASGVIAGKNAILDSWTNIPPCHKIKIGPKEEAYLDDLDKRIAVLVYQDALRPVTASRRKQG